MKIKKLFAILLTIIITASTLAFPQTTSASTASKNPVLDGSYADPDIDWFDCKYWIFPTTDGIISETNGWWGSSQFHAFSSTDMVNWTDEGVILDVGDDNAGVNEFGVQIATSPWSDGNAWAPSIEKVNGKYYFYYVARIKEELMDKYCATKDDYIYGDRMAIGVAVADSPAGPYTALDEPLLYPKMMQEKFGDEIPCVIDPSVFIDDDGSKYLTFGNGIPCIIQLNDDMMSVDVNDSSKVFKKITGINSNGDNFMESIVVFKRNGTYYFTWSVNGTGDPNYHVSYGTATKLTNRVSYKGILLQRDDSQNIYGTAHQSILYMPEPDKCYIAYGRLQTDSDGNVLDTTGNHREVCIDEVKFDDLGKMTVTPTNTSVGVQSSHIISSSPKSTKITPATTSANGKIVKNYYCTQCGTALPKTTTINKIKSITLSTTSYTYNNSAKKPTVKVTDSKGKAISSTYYTVKYSSNKNVGKAKAVVTFKGNYSGTKTLTYTINPTGTKITGLTAKSKGFTVKWSKQATQTTGYQIQYSTSSSFKNAKTVNVGKNSTTSKAISKLASKKKYYVRVRTYKTVSGKNYYSSWSKAKSVTTK